MDENESETAGAAREGRDSEPLDARESKAASTIQQHRIYLYLRGLAQGGGSGESGQCAFGCMMKECEVAIVVLRVCIFFERVCAVRASTISRVSAYGLRECLRPCADSSVENVCCDFKRSARHTFFTD